MKNLKFVSWYWLLVGALFFVFFIVPLLNYLREKWRASWRSAAPPELEEWRAENRAALDARLREAQVQLAFNDLKRELAHKGSSASAETGG